MIYFDPSGNTPVLRTCEGGSGGYHWTLKNRIKYAAKRWVERYNYVKGTYVKTMSPGGGISEEDAGLAFDLMSSYLSGEIIGGGIKAIKGTSNAAKCVDEAGNIKWPSNNGFEGTPTTKTLKPGTIVDRYGSETGKFVSSQGTPYSNRSLPPGSDARPYNAYEIIKQIDVQSGEIAPWFDQFAGGMQYQFTQSIEDLIQRDI